MNFIVLLSLLSAFQGLGSDAEITPEKALELLPEGAITFSFVWQRALEGSDSFKAVKAGMRQLEAPRLRSSAITDPLFSAGVRYLQDRAEPTQVGNPFAPSDTRVISGELVASSQFSTGTRLSAGLKHHQQRIRFPANPTQDNHVLSLSAEASQSLLRNSFGAATRAKLRAGKEASEGLKANVLNQAEIWTLDLVHLFHQAWLSQRQQASSFDNLKRREKLLKAVSTRFKRGTSVAPDLFQAEAAQMRASVDFSKRDQDLKETWRALVVVLQLPASFLQVDPAKIPMKLDASPQQAQELCEKVDVNQIEAINAAVKASRHSKESSLALEKSAESEKLWNLEAFGQLSSGTVDPSFSGVWSDAADRKGPGWMLGLQLTVPLGNMAARAEWLSAQAESARASANFANLLSLIRVKWMNECEDLKINIQNLQKLHEAYEKQKKREVLERERFAIGNVSVFSAIQAGDDLSVAELASQVAEVDVRHRAWSIMALAGSLQPTLIEALKP